MKSEYEKHMKDISSDLDHQGKKQVNDASEKPLPSPEWLKNKKSNEDKPHKEETNENAKVTKVVDKKISEAIKEKADHKVEGRVEKLIKEAKDAAEHGNMDKAELKDTEIKVTKALARSDEEDKEKKTQ